MSSTSEKGMAKTLDNFQQLGQEVSTMGAQYNPAEPALKAANLKTQHTAAKATMGVVSAASGTYKNSVNARKGAYAAAKKMPGRIRNAMKGMMMSKESIADADTYIRKMRGKAAPAPKETAQGEAAENKISVSQQSYAETADHFGNLIDVLVGVTPPYKPNEEDLKVTALQAMKTGLEAKNAAVGTDWAALKAARIPRDKAMNKDGTGICDIGNAVKAYVRSVFGLKSAQYKQINKLRFPKRKASN